MADDLPEKHEPSAALGSPVASADSPSNGTLINISGHRQELERNFGLISLCGLGITTGNAWIALSGSIVSMISPDSDTVDNFASRPLQYTMGAFRESSTSSLRRRFFTGLLRPRSQSSHQRSHRLEQVLVSHLTMMLAKSP